MESSAHYAHRIIDDSISGAKFPLEHNIPTTWLHNGKHVLLLLRLLVSALLFQLWNRASYLAPIYEVDDRFQTSSTLGRLVLRTGISQAVSFPFRSEECDGYVVGLYQTSYVRARQSICNHCRTAENGCCGAPLSPRWVIMSCLCWRPAGLVVRFGMGGAWLCGFATEKNGRNCSNMFRLSDGLFLSRRYRRETKQNPQRMNRWNMLIIWMLFVIIVEPVEPKTAHNLCAPQSQVDL